MDDDDDHTELVEDLPDHPELPQEERIQMALETLRSGWALYEEKLTAGVKIRKPNCTEIAQQHGLTASTLHRRFTGKVLARKEAHVHRQKLFTAEEQALATWIRHMEEWGFPPVVWRVRRMAEELMKHRGGPDTLGKNWVQKLLSRNPDLTERWSKPMDKDRISGLNWGNTWGWFNLLEATINKYDIKCNDIWNLDEKGCALGRAGKAKVVCSKTNINANMSEPGNREWVTLLECISAGGKLTPLFIIFKAKLQKESWQNELAKGSGSLVCLSENGWTNNGLCFEWIKRVFEPHTRQYQQGEYRLLILDGHASHVSSEIIQFCMNHKIVLLCLPSHITHALQPLDVNFFGPLAQKYRNAILKHTYPGRDYIIAKEDFIQLIQ